MPKKPLVASPRTVDQPNDEESKNDKQNEGNDQETIQPTRKNKRNETPHLH